MAGGRSLSDRITATEENVRDAREDIRELKGIVDDLRNLLIEANRKLDDIERHDNDIEDLHADMHDPETGALHRIRETNRRVDRLNSIVGGAGAILGFLGLDGLRRLIRYLSDV